MKTNTEAEYRAQAEDADVRLAAVFRVRPGSLEVHYQVDSKIDTTILLLDALQQSDRDGRLIHAPLLAYVSFEAPDVLALKRITPPLPRFKSVFRALMPWARKLEAKASAVGDIRLPLPVEEHNPYYSRSSRSVYRNAEAQRIKLVVEYVPFRETMTLTRVPNAADLFDVMGAGAHRNRIEASVRLAAPVTVKRRSDQFEPV